jgi:hypothetical protein
MQHAEGAVLVNRWLRVRVAAQTAVVLVRLKEALDDLLQQKVGGAQVLLAGLNMPAPSSKAMLQQHSCVQDRLTTSAVILHAVRAWLYPNC